MHRAGPQRHQTAPSESSTAATLRVLLLLLFSVGVIGAMGDLALIGHYEDVWQLAPFVVMSAGLIAGGWWSATRERRALRTFRTAMLLLVAVGVIGFGLHFRANIEFQREVSPSLAGFDLVWKAIRGAAPPSLAPGTLLHLALIGLASTFRCPTLPFDHSDTLTHAQGGER